MCEKLFTVMTAFIRFCRSSSCFNFRQKKFGQAEIYAETFYICKNFLKKKKKN